MMIISQSVAGVGFEIELPNDNSYKESTFQYSNRRHDVKNVSLKMNSP